MKIRFFVLFLLLIFNISLLTSIFSHDIKIQQAIVTGKANVSIAQDKDGLLWIGTEDGGLFCYDGNKVEKIKITKTGNPNKVISSIFVDKEGIIWIFAAADGLYSYDKSTGLCKEYKPEVGNKNSLTSNKAYWSPNLIAEDKKGLIWVGTADGLNSYDKRSGKFTQYRHNPNNPNSLSNNSIWAVFVDRNGLVWAGTEDGLNNYDKKNNKFYCYRHEPNKNSLSDNFIYAIKEDKGGNLWVGTKNAGMDKFDRRAGTFTNYRHDPNNSNSLLHNEIVHIMVDKFDILWICNEGGTGVDRYNPKTNTFNHYIYDPKDPCSISSNNIVYSFEDSAGIVWLVDCLERINKCTYKNDIIKIYPFDKEFCGITVKVNGIYEDSSNNIWLGSYKGGLYLYTREGKFENFKPAANDPLSLPSNSIYSILDASNGKVWLGVYGGFVTLFDANKKQVIKNFKNPYATDTPWNLTKDNKNPNEIWFTSPFTGLFKFNTKSGGVIQYKNISNSKNCLSSDSVLNILQDDNTLWIGTGGEGLDAMNKITGEFTHYRHDPNDANSISGNIVVASYIDKNGGFWVTTEDGGLSKFDKQAGKFTSYGIECGFPSKCTRHILEDNDGYLWITTDFCIAKFDPIKLKVVKLLFRTDGLLDSQFNIWAKSLKDSKGNLWFSTFRGLCKFNPEEASKIESNLHIPPIVLSSFKSKEGTYNENGIKKLTEVRLAWPDNSFEFTFAALDYMDPEKNQYAYKLEGFDKDWKYLGATNFGQYSNLNPGEYTLRLKGSNNDGIWNEEGTYIKITVTPPFWMTWWGKGLGIAVFLGTIFSLFRLKTRALKRRTCLLEGHNAKLNNEIRERKRAEDELVKTIETLHKTELEVAKEHAISEIAAHVAHDIRSPLVALSIVSKHLSELPEQKRLIIRNAARRINDIANNLLQHHRLKGNGKKTESGTVVKPELASSLIDSLVSEKRIQMTPKSIDLILDVEDSAYGIFVRIDAKEFKRVISNLINNAFESIHGAGGIIRLILENESDMLTIKIIDNGCGIPLDILPKIKQGGTSVGKKEGCGLGISGAIKNIKQWNGTYDIQSKEGEGTTFIIKLPIIEAPNWFQNKLYLVAGMNVIALDDDQSIHDVWETHFQEYIKAGNIVFKHFYNPLALTEYCQSTSLTKTLFLIDYELLSFEENGLDLIEKLKLKDQAILVTSRYEETKIMEKVKAMGIKIIPKNFAPRVPIFMTSDIFHENVALRIDLK